MKKLITSFLSPSDYRSEYGLSIEPTHSVFRRFLTLGLTSLLFIFLDISALSAFDKTLFQADGPIENGLLLFITFIFGNLVAELLILFFFIAMVQNIKEAMFVKKTYLTKSSKIYLNDNA